MNRSRWTAAILGGVVTGALALGALAFWSTQDLRAQAGSVARASSWMPETASVVGFLDVTDLVSSPIADSWHEAMGVNPEGLAGLERFKRETGMDPFTDFYAVGFSAIQPESTGDDDDAPGRRPSAWGVALHGELDPERILNKVEEHRTPSVETHQGTTIYGIDHDEDTNLALAFPSSNLILAGPIDYVKAMLDVGAGQRPSAEGRLAVDWGEGWLNESSFWVAGSAEGNFGRMLRSPQGDSLPPIEDFAIAGRLDGALSLLAKGKAADPEAAAKLADVVRGLVALGSLQQGSQGARGPYIEEVLSSVQVSHADAEVTVSGRVSYEALEAFGQAGRTAADQDP